jgi:hypothetical protein
MPLPQEFDTTFRATEQPKELLIKDKIPDHWYLSFYNIPLMFPEGSDEKSYPIPLRRKTDTLTFRIINQSFEDESTPQNVKLEIKAFDAKENFDKYVSCDSIIICRLKYPSVPSEGEEIKFTIYKPDDYDVNVIEELSSDWMNDSIAFTINQMQDFDTTLFWNQIENITILYIDVSDFNIKKKILDKANEILSKIENRKDPYVIFISNLDDPGIFTNVEGYRSALYFVSQLKPSLPIYHKDKSKLSDFLLANYSKLIRAGKISLNFNYLASDKTFQEGKHELTNKLMEELFELYNFKDINNDEKLFDKELDNDVIVNFFFPNPVKKSDLKNYRIYPL